MPLDSTRIDLRVLVVSNGDLTTEALAAAMDAEGVPYTKVTLGAAGRPTIDAAFLSDTVGGVARAKYEAVVLPNDNPFGVGSPEMAALVDYEKTFAIRQVDTFTFPSAAVGLTTTGGLRGQPRRRGRHRHRRGQGRALLATSTAPCPSTTTTPR